ncbi:MAG: cytidine deaminase [Candidatus Gastranaerophilales bacterium]|nr:cytidine deaminase [Candidatus Gastranaerophilales bacterium]
MQNKELIKLALEAAQNAYAPYSKFHVGAAVLFDDGQVVTGCNVENASYGLSLCAERNAISTAVAQGIASQVKKIAIASLEADKCAPCGACRQWIYEFSKDAIIVLKDGDEMVEYTISELLPCSFGKEFLL